MMTLQQSRLLAFIERYQRNHGGKSPSVSEMCEAMEIQHSGVCRMIYALEERGIIRHKRYVARSIEVLKPRPEAIAFVMGDERPIAAFEQRNGRCHGIVDTGAPDPHN